MELLLKSVQIVTNDSPLILAVDDDEDNLLLMTEVLKPIDCSCITATNGCRALTLAEDEQPDLILLDVMLPDFKGIEIIQHLRKNPKTSAISIVAVTALARAEDRERLILAGCDDYISKPYMIDELEALIRRYLNLSVISSVA